MTEDDAVLLEEQDASERDEPLDLTGDERRLVTQRGVSTTKPGLRARAAVRRIPTSV
jgi:hypothetical protein